MLLSSYSNTPDVVPAIFLKSIASGIQIVSSTLYYLFSMSIERDDIPLLWIVAYMCVQYFLKGARKLL